MFADVAFYDACVKPRGVLMNTRMCWQVRDVYTMLWECLFSKIFHNSQSTYIYYDLIIPQYDR